MTGPFFILEAVSQVALHYVPRMKIIPPDMKLNELPLQAIPAGTASLSKYRPDIDGLRAVAVLSVVLFHAFPKWLKGGFVGVDVFFVISGFLISSIIFGELKAGKFSLSHFYARRVRRIFPALGVVLTASLLFGWFALYPDEFQQLGKHVAGGVGFVSNLLLFGESSYFDGAAETKPLLHLWSLGIEEQFYIFWPFALWAAHKWRRNNFALICLVAAISFGANIFAANTNPTADFYLPQNRFWELLLGAALACFQLQKSKVLQAAQGNAFVRECLSAAGVLMILGAVALITNGGSFPGFWAVLPVAGATAVIAAGRDAFLNRAILSNSILVWLGLISFPLYLWHWPMLAFARIMEGTTPLAGLRATVVLGSIALAWLTYQLVERPLRFGAKPQHTTVFLVGALAVIGCAGLLLWRAEAPAYKSAQARATHASPEVMHMAGYEQSTVAKSLWRGAPMNSDRDFFWEAPSPRVAVIGDSHANRLFLGLADQSQASMINVGRGTCPPFLGVEVMNGGTTPMSCQPLTDNYLKYVRENPGIQVIVINGFYGQYNRGAMLVAGGRHVEVADALAKTVAYLAESGKTVVVALDVPEVPKTCFRRTLPVSKSSANQVCVEPRAVQDGKNGLLVSAVEKVVGQRRNVVFFDPMRTLCANGVCGEVDEHNYLYSADGNHLNEFGMKLVGAQLRDLLGTLRLRRISAEPAGGSSSENP